MAKKNLEFAKYDGNNIVVADEYGTVGENAQGGSIRFENPALPGGLLGNKQLVVIINRPDGTSHLITCTQPVSSSVRKAHENGTSKKQLLATIWKLGIASFERDGVVGQPHIHAPQGIVAGNFSADDAESATELSYEELIKELV